MQSHPQPNSNLCLYDPKASGFDPSVDWQNLPVEVLLALHDKVSLVVEEKQKSAKRWFDSEVKPLPKHSYADFKEHVLKLIHDDFLTKGITEAEIHDKARNGLLHPNGSAVNKLLLGEKMSPELERDALLAIVMWYAYNGASLNR